MFYQWYAKKFQSLFKCKFVCIITEYDFTALEMEKKVRNRIFFERGFRNLSSICYIKNKTASTQCHTVWKGIVSSLKVSFFWKSGTRCSSPDIAAATSVPLLWFSLRFSSIFIGPLCLRRLIGNKKNSLITAMKTKIESATMKKKYWLLKSILYYLINNSTDDTNWWEILSKYTIKM